MALDLTNLQQTIVRLGLRWQAGTTANSNHTPQQARNRTGAVPPANSPTLQQREQTSAQIAASPAGPAAPSLPASVDWRSKNGGDYVTAIEDQGGCGSCVAFGTIAALETWIRIANNNANMAVDKSEAHLWFCYGPKLGAGACPAGGWWPDQSYSALPQGITDAACFPYTDAAQACKLCTSWQDTLTHVTGSHTLNNVADMKSYLSNNGPLTTCFTVYEDFYYYYTSGIYTYNSQTSGDVIGGHCVCIVGYNDTDKYWIAKNSWGTGWGESGFFRISYGSAGIDAEMWAINGIVFPKAATTGSALAGYETTFNNQQHVIFISSDNHVHELVYTDHWAENDLTSLAGAPIAAGGSKLTGYQTSYNNQQHVNYLGADNHVHELVYKSSWGHTDLTAAAGAPAARAGSPLAGYETAYNNQQHVNYIDTNNHVHELVYKSSWGHTDLTSTAGAPAVAQGSPIDGYATTYDNQQHVNYIGADNHVHELVYKSSWGHTDLTSSAGAPAPRSGTPLAGYQSTFNNQQHVNYIGTDNHVHEIVFKSSWSHTDLTAAASGAPQAAAGSGLTGYATSNSQQHVNYIGTDGHVHELVYKSSWGNTDLTAASGCPSAVLGGSLDGYETSGQQHVNFIGVNGYVFELLYTDHWSFNDLVMSAR